MGVFGVCQVAFWVASERASLLAAFAGWEGEGDNGCEWAMCQLYHISRSIKSTEHYKEQFRQNEEVVKNVKNQSSR